MGAMLQSRLCDERVISAVTAIQEKTTFTANKAEEEMDLEKSNKAGEKSGNFGDEDR